MGETANAPAIRRLAAILAADVVGYSRLMGGNEEATLARVQATFAQAALVVTARGGRIFKTMGDAFLAEFPSAVGAVQCAAELQAALAADAGALRLRMGVHLGDVMPQGDDLFGDGVNIAARLEGVAQPGGVALSADVANAVRGKLPFALVDQGEKTLKNIERPIRVFYLCTPGKAGAVPGRPWRSASVAAALLALCSAGAGWWVWPPVAVEAPIVAAPAPVAQAGVPRLSFVVLPFANRGGDAEQDYFVDGLTDSLTTDLSRLDGSFIISRGSAFTYKGRAVDARQVGRELGVRYVVEGSVLRSGERVRVTAQLVDAESGRTLWSDSFDGERRDMLDMVDSATARLGRALGVQAIEQASRRTEREQGLNPDAADLALRGWASINRGLARENLDAAEASFRAALSLQPLLTAALNGLAWVQAQRIGNDTAADRLGAAREAERLLAQVLRQDPENAIALTVQCWVEQQTGRVQESIINCQRALRSNPNFAATHYVLQTSYLIDNNPQEALLHISRAFQLSPRDPLLVSFHYVRGVDLFYLHREQEAILDFEHARRLGAKFGQSAVYLAATYALVGRQAEAEALATEIRQHMPQATISAWRASMRARSTDPEFQQSRERLFDGMRSAGIPHG